MSYRRIVLKVGTSTITTPEGRIDSAQIDNLASQIERLHREGRDVLVVSSGAIAAGVEALGLSERPRRIAELQAAASVGQGLLVHRWGTALSAFGIRVGQVLLTQFDFTHRELYLNARNTLRKLLDLRVIPVINENDATAVQEIRMGDNDGLAAMVASLIDADLLVMLSDIPGVYRRPGEKTLIERIEEITPEVEALAFGPGSRFASGGMVTKFEAARIATNSGVTVVVADGRRPGVVGSVVGRESVGTLFAPRRRRAKGRKVWIAFGRFSKGQIVVDDGAKRAIVEAGKSLLPAGVVESRGEFRVGDTVDVLDASGRVIAKGLTNYSAGELARVKGKRSGELAEVFGPDFSEEVIHRDCMALVS